MHSVLSYSAYVWKISQVICTDVWLFLIEWGQQKYLDEEAPDTDYLVLFLMLCEIPLESRLRRGFTIFLKILKKNQLNKIQ